MIVCNDKMVTSHMTSRGDKASFCRIHQSVKIMVDALSLIPPTNFLPAAAHMVINDEL